MILDYGTDEKVVDAEILPEKIGDFKKINRSPGRPKTYKIKGAPQSSGAYYINPQQPIDIASNSLIAEEKYKLSMIESEFAGLSECEKLRISYMELVRRLTVESHRSYITDVNWDDADSVRLRNAQLINLKNMLTVIKMMQELVDKLRITDATEADKFRQLNDEAKSAVSSAQKLLSMRVVS